MPLLLTDEDEPRNRRREDNTPWWIGSIIKLGVPAAIALFLIWFIVSTISPSITFIKENLVLHADSATRVGREIHEQNEKLMKVLQQICMNSAKNNQERNGCF